MTQRICQLGKYSKYCRAKLAAIVPWHENLFSVPFSWDILLQFWSFLWFWLHNYLHQPVKNETVFFLNGPTHTHGYLNQNFVAETKEQHTNSIIMTWALRSPIKQRQITANTKLHFKVRHHVIALWTRKLEAFLWNHSWNKQRNHPLTLRLFPGTRVIYRNCWQTTTIHLRIRRKPNCPKVKIVTIGSLYSNKYTVNAHL